MTVLILVQQYLKVNEIFTKRVLAAGGAVKKF